MNAPLRAFEIMAAANAAANKWKYCHYKTTGSFPTQTAVLAYAFGVTASWAERLLDETDADKRDVVKRRINELLQEQRNADSEKISG